MKDYLTLLNDKQKEACIDTKGPSLIVAGAGSGKTRVLTSRIAYLIEHENVSPSNILAITFTNKAAKEMQERVDDILGGDYSRVTCKTFHSFCACVLRNDISALEGRKRSFQIIDDDDTETAIRDAMVALNYDTKLLKPSTVANYVSEIKSKIKDFDDFDDYEREKIENIYSKYNDYLFRNNLLDFDDLLLLTVDLFNDHNEILEKYQDQYKYILVDEFQDSSNIQYELVELLAHKYKNIFIVGDEDQSIYSFRGANIGNIRKFMKTYPNYHEHILDQNYRSTQSILDCANNLIKNNKERIKKDLWTNSGKGTDVELNYYDGDSLEAKSIASTIRKLVNQEGYNYSDFAIIYRNNYLSRNFEDRLLSEHIPYRVYSGLSFYKREEVKDMMAYLRLVLNMDDFYSFKRALLRPKRGIGDTTLSKIEATLNDVDGNLIKAIEIAPIQEKARICLTSFMTVISELNEALDKKTLREFYQNVFERTGYKKYIAEIEDEDKKIQKSDNISELLNAIVAVETEGNLRQTLEDFLQTVSLLTEMDIEDENNNHVSLITMHSAKGLEFRCVFAPALEDDVIPGTRASEKTEFEEERRILYVCLTRAMERLYVSCSSQRFKFGESKRTIPSRFLKELELIPKSVSSYSRPQQETPHKQVFSPITERPKKPEAKADMAVGDKVYHEIFKNGVICGIVEGYYIIRFEDMPSPKKVIINHPLLKKA